MRRSLLALMVAIALVGGTGVAAACWWHPSPPRHHFPHPVPTSASPTPTPSKTTASPTPTPTPSSKSPTPTPTVTSIASGTTPTAFGAKCDGTTDDSTALQTWLNHGGQLALPAGEVCAHTKVLTASVAGTTVTGSGELLATAEATSAVEVKANQVTVNGPRVALRSSTKRWTAYEQMGLVVFGSGDTVSHVTVQGSAAAGLMASGASDFTFTDDTARNTRADGVTVTYGSHNGTVTDPTTVDTGDDGVSIVSYEYDPTVHDVTVTGASVTDSAARGLSIVGGTGITERDFTVDGTSAAGLYVADEPSYDTWAPIDVTIASGSITDANTSTSTDHGAVLVYSGQSDGAPTNVAMSGLTVTGTRTSASGNVRIVQDSGAKTPTGITFTDFDIIGGPSSAYQGNVPQSSYEIRGWTVNGQPYPNRG
jgi:hypothetical protein